MAWVLSSRKQSQISVSIASCIFHKVPLRYVHTVSVSESVSVSASVSVSVAPFTLNQNSCQFSTQFYVHNCLARRQSFFFVFFLALRHKAPQINEERPTGVRCRPPHLDALHVIPNYQKCLFPYLCLVFTVLFHSHQVTRPWKQAEINNFDKNKSQSSKLVPTFHRVDRHHRQKKRTPPSRDTHLYITKLI